MTLRGHSDSRGRGETQTIANIKREHHSRSISACPSRQSRSSSISSHASSDFSAASFASSNTSWCDRDDSPVDSFSGSTLIDAGSSTFSDFDTAYPAHWHGFGEGHTSAGTAPLSVSSAAAPYPYPFARPLLPLHTAKATPNAGLKPIGHERAYLRQQREIREHSGFSATASPLRPASYTTGRCPAASAEECNHTPPLLTAQQPRLVGGTTVPSGELCGRSGYDHPSPDLNHAAWDGSQDTRSLPLRPRPVSADQSARTTPLQGQYSTYPQAQPTLVPLQRQQQPRQLPAPRPRRKLQQPQRIPPPSQPQPRPAGVHPRRTQTDSTWHKPPLVRQEDRKDRYVNALVDVTEALVAHIWPGAATPLRVFDQDNGPRFIHLHHFIEQLLKRTYASHCMLQVALYFCYMLGTSGALDQPIPRRDGQGYSPPHHVLHCGRRMFLSSLMLSFKVLNDKNMSSRAWRNLAGLSTKDINENEKAFMTAIDYRLFVRGETYHQWAQILEYQLSRYRCGKGLDWNRAFAIMTKARDLGSSWLHGALMMDYCSSSPTYDLGLPGPVVSKPPSQLDASCINDTGPGSATHQWQGPNAFVDHKPTPCHGSSREIEVLSAGLPAQSPKLLGDTETAIPSTETVEMYQPPRESPGSTGPVAPSAPRMGSVASPEVPCEGSNGHIDLLYDHGTAVGESFLNRQSQAVQQTSGALSDEVWPDTDCSQSPAPEPATFDLDLEFEVDLSKLKQDIEPHKVYSQDSDSGYDSSSPLSTTHAPPLTSDDHSDHWPGVVIQEDPVPATVNHGLQRAVRENLASDPSPAAELIIDDEEAALRPISQWLHSEQQRRDSANDSAPPYLNEQFNSCPFDLSGDSAVTSPSPKQDYAPATSHQQPSSALDTTFYETHHERLEALEASAEQQLSDRLSKKRKAALGSLRRKDSLKTTAKRVKVEREKERSKNYRPASSVNRRMSVDLGTVSPSTSPVEMDVC